MAEPFKNFFNPGMITQMGENFSRVNNDFDAKRFIALATKDMEKLELKQRSNQICEALTSTLPTNYRKACEILTQALHPSVDSGLSEMETDETGIAFWGVMPMADYIAEHGLDDFDYSLEVLAAMTKRSSSEFAIRHFFVADQERTMAKTIEWAKDENFHVRRLASEGSRPRLPWGVQLKEFVADPSPLLPMLEILKDDSEEYVRRSVANNINDIAKDHPKVVSTIAATWMKDASKDRARLVKHATRTLVKNGHKPTLAALGYSAPKVALEKLTVSTPIVALGEALEFDITFTSTAKTTQPLIIDFIIHHRKANGSTTPKTFKWKVIDLAAGKTLNASKRHPMKPITTRVYYEGIHSLEIQINGESYGREDFDFKL
ncbi:MAG: DNA alkylation repair protein [Rhizobiaceae bacterium]